LLQFERASPYNFRHYVLLYVSILSSVSAKHGGMFAVVLAGHHPVN
jgi:hypothetical protein